MSYTAKEYLLGKIYSSIVAISEQTLQTDWTIVSYIAQEYFLRKIH
jgi:hypothetical protein